MGRTVSCRHLAFQVAMPASRRALPRAKNTLTLASRLSPEARLEAWANMAQWPARVSLPGPSAQKLALALFSSFILACRSTSALAWEGRRERSMVGGPNWSGRVRANGVTCIQCGVENRWMVPGQLIAPAGGRGTHNGCHRYGSTTRSQVLTGL
jgi:hypothetical protein